MKKYKIQLQVKLKGEKEYSKPCKFLMGKNQIRDCLRVADIFKEKHFQDFRMIIESENSNE